MAEEPFQLPISSYDQLSNIIQAYGSIQGEAGLDDVQKLSGAGRTVVSSNNGFLLSMGIIEGGRRKTATDRGRSLAHALHHDMSDEIARYWRDICLSNEFVDRLLSAVRIRKGMDVPTLQSHVAYSAGQPKSPPVMRGALTLVEILRIAGLLVEEDGKLTAAPQGATDVDLATRPAETTSARTLTYPAITTSQPIYVGSTSFGSGQQVSIRINIQINCSPSELEGLGARVRAVLSDLSRPPGPQSEELAEQEQ